MVVIVAEVDAGAAMQLLAAAGERVYHIGRIEARQEGQAQTVVI
jgi:phosphoribosylformylglycinamidine cyclo-ligase